MPRSAQEPANALWLAMTTVGSAAQARLRHARKSAPSKACTAGKARCCKKPSGACYSKPRRAPGPRYRRRWHSGIRMNCPPSQAGLWMQSCPLSPNGCRKKQPRQPRPRPSLSRAKPEFQAFRAAPRHPQPFPPLISQAERLFWLRLNPKRRRGNPAKQSPLAIQAAKMES